MTSLYFFVTLMLWASEGIEVDVSGEISFALREGALRDGDRVVFKLRSGRGVNRAVERGSTVGSVVECVYQYPQEAQVKALISNMMNELTKVFIRGADYIRESNKKGLLSDLENAIASQELKTNTIAKILQDMNASKITDDVTPTRRHLARFKVVHSRGDSFFEQVFSNMTRDYWSLHNGAFETKYRTEQDPCNHQEEIKKMWKELLRSSRDRFLQAANQCMQKYIGSLDEATGAKTVAKLKRFLDKEREKIKAIQLKTLCDEFQLCYDELL